MQDCDSINLYALRNINVGCVINLLKSLYTYWTCRPLLSVDVWL